jgi:DNA-binding MarR family transcriptional regulator
MESRGKRETFDELLRMWRRLQLATDRFDQAVADALGLNRTDMRCLDVLSNEGPVTAGRLAQATGLTSGAMTTALDRLERAGFARRVRDQDDRRRVLVELVPEAGARAHALYRAHQEQSERLYQRHTQRELELFLDFARDGVELNERRAAELEAANRTRDGVKLNEGGADRLAADNRRHA